MRTKTSALFIYILCALSIPFVLNAHEYLLLSESYTVQKNDSLFIHLFVAQGFNIELERPLQKYITRNFSIETNAEKTNLLLTEENNQLPVYKTKVNFDGLALISMERDFASIALNPLAFSNYLKEDHLDNIVFDATKTTLPQREKYSRYLKCLILSGNDTSGSLFKKQLFYNLEIILLDNPYTLAIHDTMRAQIFFMQQPLGNKIITIRNRKGDDNATSFLVKTNASGIISFPIENGGDWVIHLTHMIPSIDTSDYDWESFWASYTFGVKE